MFVLEREGCYKNPIVQHPPSYKPRFARLRGAPKTNELTMTAAAAAAAESEAALPVVDLRSFDAVEHLAADLMRVGKDPGFFYVVGHELRDDVAADMFALAQTFFSSPLEEKLAYANGSGDLMPRDFLSKAHTGESCRMRLINYPPVSEVSSSTTTSSPPDDAPISNSEDIRAGAHSDYGSLTLLFRQPSDQGGLQVLRGGGGGNKPAAWADVPCIPNAIVVNIGDALEFWTAGRLRSTVHRVAFPRSASENVARLSIPVFIQPDRHVVLAPIKEDRRDGGGGGGADAEFLEVLRRKGYESAEPVTSREHLERRIRATYGKA
ncbi:hypothetical protein JMJ77_0014849 [Colletotrichum scovillei]|uniref:Fe2OG dioxygenase domain-containing protein n=1 Tax=Colletotrichum scovillei TaxID=1209932 RepID=A0A9P7R335_9PEZI|nr:hypothetical protein JMJ77_0014849 [Colletotrichum scovillei]KAG7056460.1 hypothetical protein JMJ78_0000259 [Colletotrichum scovillei]KAG7066391.1 hypothetical protein JMJ76_0000252 [Colletotrichum scovillei]